MSIAQSASQTASGIMQSVLTVANTVTGAVNMLQHATIAGNCKAAAWSSEVQHSTRLQSKFAHARIFDEVANKIAIRKLERVRAMQVPEYAAAYTEAVEFLSQPDAAEATATAAV